MAISKVVYGNTTLIDITDTDASATSVQSGKKFYNAAGEAVIGTGSALGHETEVLANGGIAHYINGIDLGGDTVAASNLLTGYTAHDAYGNAINGAAALSLKNLVLRPDATLVKTYTFDKMVNADLEITIPPYTTSATTLKASADLSETYTVDYTNYNYFILERMLTIPTYSVSTKAKGRAEYHINSAMYEITEIPADNFEAILNGTKFGSRTVSIVAAGNFFRLLYWSNGTTLATQATTVYGPYQAVVTPALSSGVITMKSPTIGIRGHTTYFTSTYFNAVSDIRVQYVFEIWRAAKNNLNVDGWGGFQNSMHIIECANSSNHKLT